MTKLSLVIKILTYDAVWEKLLLRPSKASTSGKNGVPPVLKPDASKVSPPDGSSKVVIGGGGRCCCYCWCFSGSISDSATLTSRRRAKKRRKKTKAAAAIKAIQERMEDKLKTEIEQKETEAKLALSEAEEMAKAELISAIAKEKVAQIEKKWQRQILMGALALEDTLSKGLPIQNEIDMLQTYLEGIHQDSMLDLVLSSLPEEALSTGTDTVQQLNQKTLQSHSTWWRRNLSTFTSRYSIVAQGVKGSKAEEIVNAWVRRARNRAITEQAVTLLQSYATCASLT
ncbi:hypothetical protein YC2023_000076 [Brassica napus]